MFNNPIHFKAAVKPASAPGVTQTITVPLKYHHVISQQGQFFRTLRNYGVQVDQSSHPAKSAVPTRSPAANGAANGAVTARIDEADSEPAAASAIEWEVIPNYQDAEDGESTWTLKGKDQADLDRAVKSINEAVKHAEAMSHVGFLTLPDRSMFPRIVGSKGANVARLRNETGADITVSRENTTIVIIGMLPSQTVASIIKLTFHHRLGVSYCSCERLYRQDECGIRPGWPPQSSVTT